MDAEASHAKGVAALRLRVIQRFRTGGRSHNSHNELKVITDAAVAKWLARHPDEALNLSIPLESELKPIGAAYRASFHRMGVEDRTALWRRLLAGTAPHVYVLTITVYLDEHRDTNWLWSDVETRRDDSRFAPTPS